ncbi:MAG: baseplate J/gp47 family protein [Ruminococcus flavefaciens]|nr:baseplate J/gp47 family protein [Ruminococcus flavefaciens]
MFEDMTFENLLEEVLDEAPDDIDTRQGSIFYDAVAAITLKIAKLYSDLGLVIDMTTVATATGDALDTKASEYGIERHDATPARYYANFEGVTPNEGERFFTDESFFTLQYDSLNNIRYFEAEDTGTEGNAVTPGTLALPVGNIEGLEGATFGTIYEYGADIESDEALRARVQSKISGPAENGNKEHYKLWCEEVENIGRARIYPLWNGPNTVKAVLVDMKGNPCSQTKVSEVQNYVDPATKGYRTTVNGKTYVVGDGLGEGRANIGAHFTAMSAEALPVNVSFTAELEKNYTVEVAQAEVQKAVGEYLQRLCVNAKETTDVVVRLTTIGGILTDLACIVDYRNLLLNGEPENIIPGQDDVPVLGEVDIAT